MKKILISLILVLFAGIAFALPTSNPVGGQVSITQTATLIRAPYVSQTSCSTFTTLNQICYQTSDGTAWTYNGSALVQKTNFPPFSYSIVIENLGSNPVYLGYSNAVTTANAPIYLPPGSSFTQDKSYPATIYGICGGGLSSTASWMEESQ